MARLCLVSKLFGVLVVALMVWAPLAEAGPPDYRFYLTSAHGPTGTVRSVQSLLDVNAAAVDGWSFGLCHDTVNLSVATAAAGATTLVAKAGAPADFIAVDVFPTGIRMGVVIDNFVMETLGAGTGYQILDVDYNLDGPGGTAASVAYCDTVGVPPADVLVVVATVPVVPTTESTTIQITNFLRGDFNGDFSVNATDQSDLLDYLFEDGIGPLDCFGFSETDTADVNDNEFLTIADFLRLRNALVGGGSIPAPSVLCGDDTTTTTNGFDTLDPDYRIAVGDLVLLPPVMPTNRRVAFPLNVDVPVDITALTIVLQYDDTALRPFDPDMGDPPPISSPGDFKIRDENGALVITIYAPNDGDVLVSGVSGAFQNVGTLFMHLEDGFVFPPPEYAPELTVGSILYRATIVDTNFDDHHPELLSGEFEFVRGNANSDNAVDIGDPIFILAYLFNGGPTPNCLDAADGNNDSAIDIADPISILNWLFGGGPIIPQPYPQCGLDQGPIDFLPCNAALPSDACFD